jgi:type IV secretory pathway VirJ component
MRKLFFTLALCCPAVALHAAESSLEFGRFGAVAVYRPEKIESVVIFISGDGGWNLGVVDMARMLRNHGALVLGVDIVKYFKAMRATKDDCWYPAADFEALSQYAQKDLGLPEYIRPVIGGFSSGATLAYALLAQAPPNTFKGAVSLGFCPDLETPKPLCKGAGLTHGPFIPRTGYVYGPAALSAPWVAFQGLQDKVCDPAKTEAFVKDVRGGDIVLLPKVGHGFGSQKNWVPQFEEVFKRLLAVEKSTEPPAAVADLPLLQFPLETTHPYFAVIVSGDGGWAGIDREVAGALIKDGVPVVGLDSLKYFWKARTPAEAGADLSRVVDHFSKAWGKRKVLLVGYSRGADILPFAANRLTPEAKAEVGLLALLGPARKAEFEFKLADWLGESGGGAPVKPEAEAWAGSPVLCFYGKDDKGNLCETLDPARFSVVRMGGGHHFGGAYAEIAARILKEMR